MNWSDEGIILGSRRHGETSLILELMTAAHGRHLGLVKGARRSRDRAALQPGNTVSAAWRARLDEHLGNFTIEPVTVRAASLMDGAAGLYALQILAGLLRLLPERDSHPALYRRLAHTVECLGEADLAGALIVQFELELLRELGFGLDLETCAATGVVADLIYVSPKSGRAVSRKAGAPFCDRLLKLPAFLTTSDEVPPAPEILAGFRLTEFFLRRHVLDPRGLALPPARENFIALLIRPPVAA
jgi:DNA repair protein RecO (recombination protein O)